MSDAAAIVESSAPKPGASVLFVDDEPEVLAALRRVFHGEPYDVVTANDGATALDYLDRYPVRVVMADERMPGMSGSELLGEVRRRWPRIGRVILTGHPGCDVMIRGLEEAVDFLLYKPWDDQALKRTILRLVEVVERTSSGDPAESAENSAIDLGGEGG
ncbi:MAG TPA: response regulator [Planctomycetota bacterium]|nr:response regulator [Planctomycetota bacterium]